jgi:MoaA/NifB/PqqE/SkfB family radical SAM enzyme
MLMKNYCSQPWIGLDISAQGEFKPCCKFNKSISNNIEDYYNSKLLQEVKDFHSNDLRHPSCKRCWDDEDAGVKSKRQLDAEYVLVDNIDIADDNIKLLGISFGNTCNLACRTCGSYASSKWASELKRHGNFNEQKLYGHNKFYKDSNFITSLIQKLGENVHIDITGGEPLLSDSIEHHDFINMMAKKESVTLHYVTNCTFYPSNKLLELWKTFKKVDIQFSIDGTGELFEYIRWPANWETVYKNIKRYQEYQSINDNIQLSISHTLSILNVSNINDFLSWCKSESLPEPYIGFVSKPLEYNIKALPKNIKLKLKDSLPESITNFMMSEDLSEHYSNALTYNKFLDVQRNQLGFLDISKHTF